MDLINKLTLVKEMTNGTKKRPREEIPIDYAKKPKCSAEPSEIIKEIIKKEQEEAFSDKFLDFASTVYGSRILAVSYLLWICERHKSSISWDIKTILEEKYMKFVESANRELRYMVHMDNDEEALIGFCGCDDAEYRYKKRLTREQANEEFVKAIQVREELAKEMGLDVDECGAYGLIYDTFTSITQRLFDVFGKRRRLRWSTFFTLDLPDLMSDRVSEKMTFWFHPNEKYIRINQRLGVLRRQPLLRDHAFLFDCLQKKPYNDNEANNSITVFSLELFRKKAADRKVLEIIRPIFLDRFNFLLEES